MISVPIWMKYGSRIEDNSLSVSLITASEVTDRIGRLFMELLISAARVASLYVTVPMIACTCLLCARSMTTLTSNKNVNCEV